MMYLVQMVLMGALVIFIHELGHYAMAKSLGFPVNKFNIGLGPLLYTFQFKETKVKFKLFPVAGLIRLYIAPKELTRNEYLKVAMVSLAGPLANVITGLLFAKFSFMFFLYSVCVAIANMIPSSGSDGMNFITCLVQASKGNK